MSVRFSFARVTCSTQLVHSDEREENFSHSQFVLVQLCFDRWNTSSKSRMRQFANPAAAQAYCNKLLEGGWICANTYNDAYTAIEALTVRFYDMKKFISCSFFVKTSVVGAKSPGILLRSVECEGGLSSTETIGTKEV